MKISKIIFLYPIIVVSIFAKTILSMDKDLAQALKQSLASKQAEDAERKAERDLADAIKNSLKSSDDDDKKVKEENFHIVPVLPQKGADCGYHAIKNGNILYQWLAADGILKQETKKEIERRLNVEDEENFPLEKWRSIVAQVRKDKPTFGTKAGANLFDIEIANIIKNELKLSPETYSVIANINEIAENNNKILEPLAKTVEKIRLNPNATHIFILGNMKETNVACGHWIAVVLKRDNRNYEYYIMDSLGSKSKTINPMVKSLDTVLKKARLDIAKIPTLAIIINEAIDAIQELDIKTCLAKLKQVIESKLNPFSDKTFAQENTSRVKQILNGIIEFGSEEDKKEAQELLNKLALKSNIKT